MGKGSRSQAEWRDYENGLIRVKQLTNYKGHSHHLYFTNSGWYAGGQKLLFGSDRCNATNLFSLDLAAGEITQVTDLSEGAVAESQLLFTSVNPHKPEAYFWADRKLWALDLVTFAERILYRVPDGYAVNMTSVTADGKFVCTGIYEDLSGKFKVDLLHGYVGFAEYWKAKPHSQILQICTECNGVRVLFEEDYWIGHVNASPTQPDILTFCHEGPWEQVDNRIWGLDSRDGSVWKIRPTAPGERVGHEYWFADGERIGFHGRNAEGQAFYGSTRYNNTGKLEFPFSSDSMHFHSNDSSLVVGDGTRSNPKLMLWRLTDGRYEGPRTILEHRGTFQTQQLHIHPRFSPDGQQILFTADPMGYGQLHLIDTPNFDALADGLMA